MDSEELFETRGEVAAALDQAGATFNQLSRWRREGLLPAVKQVWATPYRGSETRFPPGTCRQIAAIARLSYVKKKFEWIGRRLWWEGYEVDEIYWRKPLQTVGKWIDRMLRLIRWLHQRADRQGERDIQAPTLAEGVSQKAKPDKLLSRALERVGGELSPIFLRVFLDVAGGRFDGFEEQYGGSDDSSDKIIVLKGLDLQGGEHHTVLGQRIGLTDALEQTLLEISASLDSEKAPFEAIATGEVHPINSARDDVRNTFDLLNSIYVAFSWIHGPQAFGLRFANWIYRLSPEYTALAFILLFVQMRRFPNSLHSSDDIAAMAKTARMQRDNLMVLKAVRNDPRFVDIVNPAALKIALSDKILLARWVEKLKVRVKEIRMRQIASG